MRRLNKNVLDTVLLHNWSKKWDKNSLLPLRFLSDLKMEGMINKIGISLPDGYNDKLDGEIIDLIDVIEAPYNPKEFWITAELTELLGLNLEVILRSIFLQGMLVSCHKYPSDDLRSSRYSMAEGIKRSKPDKILKKVWKMDTSITIGMTTERQMIDNIKNLELI